jgi:AraC family transcriptional regulator of adaptative response/methylated-DNA-[protein]-cysteine methyltransferase
MASHLTYIHAMNSIEPMTGAADGRDYDRVAKSIAFIMDQHHRQPPLDEVAAHVNLSPFHFQRLFKRWAGVSPKQFAGFLTVEYAKTVLEKSATVLSTSFDAGLSGASRLHDAFVSVEAMTPGDYKAQGRDLVIRYGVHETRFGRALILVTDRGICGLEFTEDEAAALEAARTRWPLSKFVHDHARTAAIAAGLGQPLAAKERLLLKGTNFQVQVWQALLRVPAGAIVTYGDIAREVCTIKATRAVGTALGQNTIGYLVPCHRVLRNTGLFTTYRWGATRRRAMLAWEASQGQKPE